jgi:hypothetical protein
VALVIGANDVTNPVARTDTTSPIYGMPILDVDAARSIVVIKRSMGRGYAGIDNSLYTNPKTGMLFADAKAGLRTCWRPSRRCSREADALSRRARRGDGLGPCVVCPMLRRRRALVLRLRPAPFPRPRLEGAPGAVPTPPA